jgi:anaerobic selenocysteine-containing dehydrogenase
MTAMAVTAKKLDVKVGDLVEIEGRTYDVVSDKHGGVALEPAITKTVAEIHAEHGSRPMTSEEFAEYFGDLPSDGEG